MIGSAHYRKIALMPFFTKIGIYIRTRSHFVSPKEFKPKLREKNGKGKKKHIMKINITN